MMAAVTCERRLTGRNYLHLLTLAIAVVGCVNSLAPHAHQRASRTAITQKSPSLSPVRRSLRQSELVKLLSQTG